MMLGLCAFFTERLMKHSCRVVPLSSRVAAFFAVSLVQFGAFAADVTNVVHYPPANTAVPRMLQDRAREQVQAATNFKAFHEFQFADRADESRIAFQQTSVEDALKTWKPAHYDHG